MQPKLFAPVIILLDMRSGERFFGFGRSKKACQHHAAHLALKAIFGIETELPDGAGRAVSAPSEMSSSDADSMEVEFATPDGTGDNETKNYTIAVNERCPGLVFSYRTEGSNEKAKVFVASAIVPGSAPPPDRTFEGRGRSKKQAKYDCCFRILRDYFKVKIESSDPSMRPWDSEEINTKGSTVFADKIQNAIVQKFYELCENTKNEELHKMKVLAG